MLLCLDVAFNNIGYSIFHEKHLLEVGLITAPKAIKSWNTRITDERADRCASMTGQLISLIKEKGVQGITAELPSGSQNAAAVNQLGWASGMVVSTARVFDIPMEHVTQRDVKLAVAGTEKASKDDIMDEVAARFNWRKDTKSINITLGKRKGSSSEQASYFVMGASYPKTKFEHIADSIGVYWASRDRNLVRMFG
jgi:Holliday junction resolvasome RuvABC endonuclease subunit